MRRARCGNEMTVPAEAGDDASSVYAIASRSDLPMAELRSVDGLLVGWVVATPAGFWIVDALGRRSRQHARMAPAFAAQLRDVVSGEYQVWAVRITAEGRNEMVEADGTLWASPSQIAARWMTPGDLSRDEAVTAINWMAGHLSVSTTQRSVRSRRLPSLRNGGRSMSDPGRKRKRIQVDRRHRHPAADLR